jgi:hypothetical protein
MRQTLWHSFVMTVFAAAACAAEPASSTTLFESRLVPILKSDTASSCTECHFSGVELRHYLRASEADTFAALRQQGLIDPAKPEQSKLLTFIARKPDRPDPLLEKVRQAELVAVREWIVAAAKNPELFAAKPSRPLETELPVEVIRHTRRDRVLAAFVDNIWSEMGRCLNCHSPERNRNQIARHGKEKVDAISWIVPRDPQATLERLVADGNIDLDRPETSPVLTKPAGLVEHGGGPKFLAGGETYQKFLGFLKDYATVRAGTYRQSKDLPKPVAELAWLTEQHLKLTDLPDAALGGVLRGDVYPWDDQTQAWSNDRAGFVEGPVNAQQRVFQNMVTQTAKATDDAAATAVRKQPRLPAGRYRVVLSIDRRDGAQKSVNRDWQPLGTIQVDGDWPPGYQPPKTVSAKALKPETASVR